MFGSLGNMMGMLGNMKKMAADYKKIMADLKEKTVEASVGGDQVVVTANGIGEIIQIKISPELVASGDVGMIEELTLSGVKSASEKARELMQKDMSELSDMLPMDELKGLLGNLPK